MLWASGIDWRVSGASQSDLLVRRLLVQRGCSLASGTRSVGPQWCGFGRLFFFVDYLHLLF